MAKTTAKIVNLDEKEALLSAKYPERRIVPGSLMPASWEDSPFPGKETVEITCVDCRALRRIATQDLFQVSRCVECTKAHQRAQKLAKRAADPEAQARKARAEAAKEARQLAEGAKLAARIDEELARKAARAEAAQVAAARMKARADELTARAASLVS